MQENYVLVQKGFRILVRSMSGYIGQIFNRKYGNRWWGEVLYLLNDQYDLPEDGEYSELTDSLDIANCIRVIDRGWRDVFKYELSINCRTWAKELMGIRNMVSHLGQKDIEQPIAERALDTMALLCKEIDPDGSNEIRELYKEVRAKADENNQVAKIIYSRLAQPASESKRGELKEGSLLQSVGTDLVQQTDSTRKVTYGGKTVVFPVYKVRLDALYYNDQNDRIATWITRYEAENGTDSLTELNIEIYNRVIENFVYDSNPESINKTQKNISLVGQRESAVTLADGRIVDGNRRFTCLRRLQRDSDEPLYLETVIMDMDINADKKQIKLLELAIQHGEEKKVDYDLIDYAIGTYRDVVQTKLLTVDEYAESANEAKSEVKKRIEIAKMISEFLDYIRLPEQYHVAREYQVYSLFQEMMSPMRKLDETDKEQLKKIAFSNVMMHAIPDQRKFIRDIKGLIKANAYQDYFKDQRQYVDGISEAISKEDIHSKENIEKFADENQAITKSLQLSMENALLRSRSEQLKSRPAENVVKSIALLKDIDTRLVRSMDSDEVDSLKAGLDEMKSIVDDIYSCIKQI